MKSVFFSARRLALALATALAFIGLTACDARNPSGQPSAKFHSLDVSEAGYAQDFSLLDMHGQRRTLADFRGKVVVLFFGFLQCPDVCPTTLGDLVQVKKQLGADGERLQVIFVTVDPQRDTAPLLRNYLAHFDPSFLALIPTPDELRKQVAPGFRVMYHKQEGNSPHTYSMEHSTGLLLVDPQGKVRLHSNYGAKPQAIAQDVATLLHEKN